jgi:hypothetical protein
MSSAIYNTQPCFKKILNYHGIKFSGDAQPKIDGFEQYNWLVDINECFSSAPSGDIVDRTQTVHQPWLMQVCRPWTVPVGSRLSLEQCFEKRVHDLTQNGQIVNLFWSGGIDSTAMVVGFLNHCKDLSQVRVLYSANSQKEHPGFYLLLQTIPQIELVEFGGDVYLNQNFDGMFVSGDGADDLTASIDWSFFEKHQWSVLHQPWKSFFYDLTQNTNFVDFCEQWFALSGRPIDTVLEARWWFYTATKIQKFPSELAATIHDHQPLPLGFFDCYEFEHFMWHNLDLIIPNKNYSSYKQFLKDYIFLYDKDARYKKNKEKQSSSQLALYKSKKVILQNKHYIMLLADGTRIRTPNLPLLSEIEYRKIYGNSLDYLFNTQPPTRHPL